MLVLVILIFANCFFGILNTISALSDDLATIQSYADMEAMVSAIGYMVFMALSIVQTLLELLVAVLIILRNRHVIT